LGAVGALTLIEIALIPHALPNLTRTAPWIVGVPLSLRIQQVPVAFGMNTFDLGPAVSYGLVGAAVLAAIVIGLLVIGGEDRELRGAGVAAALAGAVLLTPILFALLHHDDYIARGLVPGWIPLAVLVGAACTAARARLPGAALAVVLLALFLYAGIRIDGNPAYQRPDWRGVATALGQTSATRAIVAYDGGFASQPLAIYLPGIPWETSSPNPVSVSEVDVVGSTYQTLDQPLPAGATLLGSKSVEGFLVERFALRPSWHLSPSEIGKRATSFLGPAPPSPTVLIQRPSA